MKERLFKALHEKNSVQRQIARRLFGAFQVLGFHLTADHFYDNIPNTKLIGKTYHGRARRCSGIDFRCAGSEAFLLECLSRFSKEILDGSLTPSGFVNPNAYLDTWTRSPCTHSCARPGRRSLSRSVKACRRE